jgi:hypothetical protein
MDQLTPIQLAADLGEVGSMGHLEIPIQGPGGANLLVCINGITLSGLDVNNEEPEHFRIVVETEYKLRDDDQLIGGIAAFASLASIAADGGEPLEIALNEVSAIRRTSNVVALIVSGELLGDTTLFRIGYQISLTLLRMR